MSTTASSIEWTDRTWNPVRGCSRISPGCEKCYAEQIAGRFSGPGLAFEGFATRGKNGARWTRKLALVDDALDAPLGWKKPARVFVNSMSDLFHEALPIEAIDRVMAVMLLAPQHTFQVLTKRASRMREYLSDEGLYARVLRAADEIRHVRPELSRVGISNPTKFPARWIWFGVSVEDQERADERIPELLDTPAAVRFLSCEPLLERLKIRQLQTQALARRAAANLSAVLGVRHEVRGPKIDWVIVGGESGSKARPFHINWAASIVEQCRAAGVPVFVKQMGANVVDRNDVGFDADLEHDMSTGEPTNTRGWSSSLLMEGRVEENINGFREEHQGALVQIRLRDKKGSDPAEWPFALRAREFPEVRS